MPKSLLFAWSLVIAVLIVALSRGVLHAQAACLNDSEARTEVQAHKLVSVQNAVTVARERAKGDLLSAHLCRQASGFVYQISILGRNGRVDRLRIDASNGHISD